ncbi:MAG: hypothetical protein JWQ03_3247 [Variovorax sp.]|nr:hypothetical protein [Variovorax sp.]
MITVTEALRRIGMLTPARSGKLIGEGAYVLSPASGLPDQQNLRELQRERSDAYMLTGDRSAPGYAPSYWVTSNGALIAWVSLDGAHHFTDPRDWGIRLDVPAARAMMRHQDVIRAAWDQLIDYSHDDDERHPDDEPEDPYGFDADVKGFLATYAE